VRPPRELNPNISPALEAVILRALAKTPAERPANMDALAEQLQLTPEGARLMEAVRQASPLSLSGIPSPRRAPPPPAAEDSGRASQAPLPLVTPARASTSLDQLDMATPGSGVVPSSTRTAATSTSILSTQPTSRRGVAVGVAGALALGALGVGLALLRPWAPTAPATAASSPQEAPHAPDASARAPASGTAASEPPPSAPPPSSAPPAASASSTGVLLRVVTIPSGALILKGDFQVCDSSPCDLRVEPNEAVELVAIRGNLRGVAKVLAQRQQTVQIRLFQQTAGAAGKPPPAPSGRNVAPVPMCEFTDGDLKILRPCK
jgi:serine/threonine-protein kinase